MKKKVKALFIFISIMTLLIMPALLARASSSEPVETIKEMLQLMEQMASEKEIEKSRKNKNHKLNLKQRQLNERYNKLVSAKIDFTHVCVSSMSKKWQTKYWTSTEKREYFIALFTQLIEEIVYPKGKDYFHKLRIVYRSPEYKEVNGEKRAYVFQEVYYKDKIIELEYWLHSSNNGWQIIDIGVEGEWWVPSFRQQFNHIITKKSYDELVSLMKKKLKSVKESKTL